MEEYNYGIIMNFDSNTFCVMGVKGMYIIKRSDINSMYPSSMSKDKWEESRIKYLKSCWQNKDMVVYLRSSQVISYLNVRLAPNYNLKIHNKQNIISKGSD